jgi:hypothetical protein
MDYPYLDNDTMAMWSTAPTGFKYVFFCCVEDWITDSTLFSYRLDEWGTYVSNMSESDSRSHIDQVG